MAQKAANQCAVLIVEDDVSIRKLVRTVLNREGYQVDVVADGLEAVLQLGVVEYDVILLDLMMPHLDGFELLRTLATNAPEQLRHIVVTSAASPTVISERLRGIAVEVLAKPFDLDELVTRVRGRIDAQMHP